MVSEETKKVIERAKAIYDQDLRESLEAEDRDRFVAIEPAGSPAKAGHVATITSVTPTSSSRSLGCSA